MFILPAPLYFQLLTLPVYPFIVAELLVVGVRKKQTPPSETGGQSPEAEASHV